MIKMIMKSLQCFIKIAHKMYFFNIVRDIQNLLNDIYDR